LPSGREQISDLGASKRKLLLPPRDSRDSHGQHDIWKAGAATMTHVGSLSPLTKAIPPWKRSTASWRSERRSQSSFDGVRICPVTGSESQSRRLRVRRRYIRGHVFAEAVPANKKKKTSRQPPQRRTINRPQCATLRSFLSVNHRSISYWSVTHDDFSNFPCQTNHSGGVGHVVVLTSNIPMPVPSTNPSAHHHHPGITTHHLGITTSATANAQLKLSQQTAHPDVVRAPGRRRPLVCQVG
jgi:hypothetical protein